MMESGPKRPQPNALGDVDKLLQAAAAARFCALGYYVAADMELAEGFDCFADVAGIRPVLKELKNRSRRGPAPAGVLYLLDEQDWTPTETVIEATGKDPNFARGVLLEAEGKGWVEKRVVDKDEDAVHWRLKDYKYPARDAFVLRCGSGSPMKALGDLQRTVDCCHRSYLILDYEVDPEFLDMCFKSGIGLMVYVPRNGYFREILPAEEREPGDKKGFMSLSEKVLFENYILRLQKEGI